MINIKSKICVWQVVALNSKFNGSIVKKTKFKNVFIQPNASDGGGSLGSAIYLSSQNDKNFKNIKFNDAYLGTSYPNNYIEKNIINKKIKESNFKFEYMNNENLNSFICHKLKNSEIIGWFKGKCEWGPRALGNRSILADPRNPKIKDIINEKLKEERVLDLLLHQFLRKRLVITLILIIFLHTCFLLFKQRIQLKKNSQPLYT